MYFLYAALCKFIHLRRFEDTQAYAVYTGMGICDVLSI
jgi:hypothetical protein